MLCDNIGLSCCLLCSTSLSRPARSATEYWRHHITWPWRSIIFCECRREQVMLYLFLHLADYYWICRFFIRAQDHQPLIRTNGMMRSPVFAIPTWRSSLNFPEDLRSCHPNSQTRSKTTETWAIRERCNSRLPNTWPLVKKGEADSSVRIIVHGFGGRLNLWLIYMIPMWVLSIGRLPTGNSCYCKKDAFKEEVQNFVKEREADLQYEVRDPRKRSSTSTYGI